MKLHIERKPLPQRPESGTWHVYVDETAFSTDEGQSRVGVGALAVERPIETEVVHRALADLNNDPERPADDPFVQALDRTTLSRGFFHAADDSKNAHSWLARAVAGHVVGRFLCTFSQRDGVSDERGFRSSTASSLLMALSSPDPVSVTFEERSGFSRTAAHDLVEDFYDGLDESSYEVPWLKVHYPRITLDVHPKMNPGLQVADFLLWSVVQERFRPRSRKARFAKWAGLVPFYLARYEDQPTRWTTYALNTTVAAAFDTATPEQYPLSNVRAVYEESDELELANLYFLAERVLRGYARSDLPPNAAHLKSRLQETVRRLDDARKVDLDDIRGVLRMFLRLFDMVPIYDRPDLDDAAWLKLIRAKRFLGLALRQDLLHGVRTLLHFATVRQQVTRSAPEVLGL